MILKIMEYCVLLAILFIQVYLLAVALPHANNVYGNCSLKVLCDNNAIKDKRCDQFKTIANEGKINITI